MAYAEINISQLKVKTVGKTSIWVNDFEVDVNDSIFSGNEQQKVYFLTYQIKYIFLLSHLPRKY